MLLRKGLLTPKPRPGGSTEDFVACLLQPKVWSTVTLDPVVSPDEKTVRFSRYALLCRQPLAASCQHALTSSVALSRTDSVRGVLPPADEVNRWSQESN